MRRFNLNKIIFNNLLDPNQKINHLLSVLIKIIKSIKNKKKITKINR